MAAGEAKPYKVGNSDWTLAYPITSTAPVLVSCKVGGGPAAPTREHSSTHPEGSGHQLPIGSHVRTAPTVPRNLMTTGQQHSTAQA